MEEDIIQIVPVTQEVLDKADFYIGLIRQIVPTATVTLIGSLAIPVSTKNEMDLLVEIDGSESILAVQEKIRDESEGIFGVGPVVGTEGFSRSKKKFGIICELHILQKGSEKARHYFELVRRFKADPELASKYEQLKSSLHGATSIVYKEEKRKFLDANGL